MSLIELSKVSKSYPGPPRVDALVEVDMRAEGGDSVAVIGPSGSGKSTLLHILGALDRPTTGSVRIAGQDISELSDKQLSGVRANLIGFVFQDFFLLSGTTALENVAQGLLYRGVSPAERRERAKSALTTVGLAARMHHLPSQLSGGERQRVAIARAIVGNPSVVFADEPTGNLDSKTGAGIVDVLLGLNAAGTTVVVITHDREVAARFSREISIKDGRIVGESSS
jgi:putative ABC transport system ATP-binding protein